MAQEEIQFLLKGAEFAYPNSPEKILRGIDLEIRAGEWVALLGSNGSGKSTLLKLLSALLLPTQGTCFVNGHDTSTCASDGSLKGYSAMVFQNPEDQIVAATLEEDTSFGPENLGCPAEEISERVDSALHAVGLEAKRSALVSSLSGGQKQRLALAGALAMKPAALLLDEATSMLDPESRIAFTDIIASEHGRGTTVIEVTHRLEEIRGADRVVVIEAGRVVMDVPAGSFLSLRTAELAAMNFAKPPLERLAEELKAFGAVPAGTQASVSALEYELCRLL